MAKMKADTVLDFAVFQLTPTRTRCELLISCKGVSEKLASGLLKPFLAHLRAAEEQIAVGGYSIRLEPSSLDEGKQNKASWFTKGTMQRFVRFVSTPEVLERVSAVETELIQLEEELSNYTNEGDDQQSVTGSVVVNSGARLGNRSNSKPRKDSLDELEADGNGNETSKCRLIKAMESRHAMLQREQGMAFARAVAAGFDMDHLSDLLAFADCFGAARLSEACHRFAALCKKQQEGGLWLDEMELVAAEGAYSYAETNGGITIAPAGLDPLNTTRGQYKDDEDSTVKDSEAAGRNDNLRRQSSGYLSDQHGYSQMMGMPPGQMPPYGHAPPWMHYGGEQVYDPRFFPQGAMQMPQNPYMNGNFPQMNPYWGGPPPAQFNNSKAESAGQDEEDDDSPPEKNNLKKNGRKSASPRRRSSTSPLKKLQVGRPGKRSGMVLIRNINYITSQDANKKSAENESDESSEFETSSEFEGKQKKATTQNSSNKKGARRKKFVAAEVSSEGSHASNSGETKKSMNEDGMFTVPMRSALHSGDYAYNFDSESLPNQHSRTENEPGVDDSFFLNGGRANGMKGSNQFGMEDQTRSSNLRSKDGMLLPHRSQAGRLDSRNQDSELSFKNRSGYRDYDNAVDDSFIMPERAGGTESAPAIGEAYTVRGQENSNDAALEDLFIVPSRRVETTRRAFELEMPGEEYVESKEKPEAPKFEPEDVWMLPERSKESLDKRWNDVDYDMEVMAAIQPKQEDQQEEPVPVPEDNEEFYEQYHEQRDAKILKESGSKRAEREAKMRSLQDTLDKRKAEMSTRFKATRSSILKTKKEKEEAERKRIEEIAAERRNRIAARTGGTSTPAKSTSVPSRATTRSSVIKPSARALNSTPTNKDSQVKKTLASRNPFSRSVPSLAELRKENTKPATARPVNKSLSGKISTTSTQESKKVESTPGAQGSKKPTAASRKSIASIRELKKVPETPVALKTSDGPQRKTDSTNLALKAETGTGIVSKTADSSKTSLQRSDVQGKVSGQEVAASGNAVSRVAAFDQLPTLNADSLHSSSSHLQQQHRSTEDGRQSVETPQEAMEMASSVDRRTEVPEVEIVVESHEVAARNIAAPPTSLNASFNESLQPKQSSKGIKKLLKFGRKSRSGSGLVEQDRGKVEDETNLKPDSDKAGGGGGGASCRLKTDDKFSSSIPAPPEDFKLRDDRISSSSFIKAPRSFFSFSNFRTKEGTAR